jgi:transposase
MFDLKPKTLYYWYRNYLSDYQNDILTGVWLKNKIYVINKETGEIIKEKPIYIAKPENVEESMTLDDKKLGKEMYTIVAGQRTGKIVMMIESTKVEELKEAIKYLGESITKVKNISCDMSPSYLKFCEDVFPQSNIVIDKFHVIKQVLEALQSVRLRIKNQLKENLTKGKKKTIGDIRILSDLELLRNCKYLLTQSQTDWNDYQSELMQQVFERFKELETAYLLVEEFRHWYDKKNCKKHQIAIEKDLFKWYEKVESSNIIEFKSTIKMIEKHEKEIRNYFQNAITNAKAENINGKIQRFIMNNYGIRDKDFAIYRIAKYFS